MGKAFKIALWSFVVVCVLFYLADLAFEIASGVKCGNVIASLVNPFCSKGTQLTPLITGVINSITDIYLLILPMPSISRL